MAIPADITKGQGVTFLGFRSMPACFEALKLTDLQGELQQNGALEALHEYLCLPDTYTILGIFFDPWRVAGRWAIIVESDEIPLSNEGEVMPEILLAYQRHPDGTNTLLKIDVQKNRYA